MHTSWNVKKINAKDRERKEQKCTLLIKASVKHTKREENKYNNNSIMHISR
jgi:hypothetical protein